MRRTTLLMIAAALLPLSACGDDAGATTLSPAAGEIPEGTRRVSCDLETDAGRVTFSFVLPDVYDEVDSCRWSAPAPPRRDAPTLETTVTLGVVRDGETLRQVHDTERPFVSEDGDDAISDLDLAEDVPVFGDTVGDRLRWDCFCDGLPTVTYLNQAAGVRLTWNGSPVLQDQIEDQLRAALASAGTADDGDGGPAGG